VSNSLSITDQCGESGGRDDLKHDPKEVGLGRVPFPLDRIVDGMGTVSSPLVPLVRPSQTTVAADLQDPPWEQ